MKWIASCPIFFHIFTIEVLNESNSLLTKIDKLVGENRLYQRKLDLRINAPNASAVEVEMAKQIKAQADDATLHSIRQLLNGEDIAIRTRDPHEHINLIPELEI